MANKRSRSDVDISSGRTEPKLGWRGYLFIFGFMIVLYFLVTFFDPSYWWLCVLVPIVILVAAILIGWKLVVKRGLFTWMRLAQQPAKLMARGEREAAEAACAKGLARARQFGEHDHRRGLMLCELAMFVKLQGRMDEALALYEESVSIMSEHQEKEPLDYFVVLNNYGICFIQLKDYERAQSILEKAIDLTFAARKREGDSMVVMPLQHVQLLQFVLHLNLAFLLMEMRELAEAEQQLREADALAPLLAKPFHAAWHNHYIAICALWEFESGKFAAAEAELAEADNPDYPPCLRAQAKLHMVRQEFAEAEALFRKYQHEEGKKGTLHLPDKLKPTLEYGECLFEQGKHDAAFAELKEARSIVVDFKLPPDETWRRDLAIWLQRARELNKAELIVSLEEELRKIPTTLEQRVTILEKLRIHPPISDSCNP
jgi:tetratricopeptide (TPR) repeat protein